MEEIKPCFEGWLEKRAVKGRFVKNWKKRYFRLEGANIAYFANPEEVQANGEVLLFFKFAFHKPQ